MNKNIFIMINLVSISIVILTSIGLTRYNISEVQTNCIIDKDIENFSINGDEIRSLTIKRDIFFTNKKEVKVKPVLEKTVKKNIDGPTITFKGIMNWDGQIVGIFYDAEKKKTLFLKPGEFIKDYKILDITSDEVVLSKKGGLSVVTLKIGGLGGL